MIRPRTISEEEFEKMQVRVSLGGVKKSTPVKPRVKPYSQFRSKWEEAYANKLELEKRAAIITAYWYEPFSLWLPGKVRYKPDFLVQTVRGELELIEVKGWSKNRRDGMTRLKVAASIYSCFVWRLVYRTKGGGWDGEYV